MSVLAYTPDDPAVDRKIAHWIEEAGGTLPLRELEQKFVERFHFRPDFAIGEEAIRRYQTTARKFKIENNLVSL